MKVGVLALQGDFREHALALSEAGATPVEVRTPEELQGVDALVLPGEVHDTTTPRAMAQTVSRFLFGGLLTATSRDRLVSWMVATKTGSKRIRAGLPVLGTCAGMIVLATQVLDGDPLFAMLDVTVRRNAYGRQVDSFETDLDVPELGPSPFHAVFIRAPGVDRVGPDVDVLASWEHRPVLARQGPVTVAAFHPELSGDARIHSRFLEEVQ
jgi:5'-phosphate synthase pdxT subunit